MLNFAISLDLHALICKIIEGLNDKVIMIVSMLQELLYPTVVI